MYPFFSAFLVFSHYSYSFFFFNDTATTEIYTLSLHDALPISAPLTPTGTPGSTPTVTLTPFTGPAPQVLISEFLADPKDRKSTRLNSSHANISYAVFCLKKKKICSAHISMNMLHTHN